MGRIRTIMAAAVVAGAVVLTPALAGAESWQMDETAGSTRMIDAEGTGLDGQIGRDVVLHEATPTGWGYRFRGDWWVVNDNRLVTWADNARLDPGTGTYAVSIRFKTGAVDPNIIQKGQANQTGGFWKLALKGGQPRCHFTDSRGVTKAIGFVGDSRAATKVADNQWHTLRCERTTTGVRLTIDPGQPTSLTKFIRGTLGRIDNTRPMVLGGKFDCDGTRVTCDYFAGVVDWVTLERPGA